MAGSCPRASCGLRSTKLSRACGARGARGRVVCSNGIPSDGLQPASVMLTQPHLVAPTTPHNLQAVLPELFVALGRRPHVTDGQRHSARQVFAKLVPYRLAAPRWRGGSGRERGAEGGRRRGRHESRRGQAIVASARSGATERASSSPG